MPPGQPILRCEGCNLLRPCKKHDGEWVCVECNPRIDHEAIEA
jgi:hypothetical protein